MTPILAVFAVLALAAGPLTAPGAGGVVEHVITTGLAEQRRVLDYWTPERMAAAIPIDLSGALRHSGGVLGLLAGAGARPARSPAAGRPPGPDTGSGTALAPGGASDGSRRARMAARTSGPSTHTPGADWPVDGAVSHTTGRVFLTLNGIDLVCSAATVRGANRDLVVTAGHCVKDGAGAWAANWTFVPGYDRGRMPYGMFTARRMFVTVPWARGGGDAHDVAMVALNTADGRHVADVAGALPIAFGRATRGAHAYGFGFPSDPPYDGGRLIYCAGRVRPDPHSTRGMGLRCDMTAGSSGGPWLTGFDPATGRGTVVSVNSFKYVNDRHTMYGPYFGSAVRELYGVAQRA